MARPREFNYQEALNKAIHTFWEKGYHASSMRDLVENMEINRASIYSSFGEKEKLYQLALKSYSDKLIEETAAFLYQYVFVREGLTNLFKTWANSAINNNPANCFLLMANADRMNFDAETQSIMDMSLYHFQEVIFRYLDYGVQQGQISPYKDCWTIATYLIGIRQMALLPSSLNKTEEEQDKLLHFSLSVLA